MPVYEFEGVRPVVDPSAYVHPTAVLIGDVVVGARCLVGPNAVLRADLGKLRMGPGSNVQDNCVLHTFPDKEVLIGENGHVGHGAILHSCEIRPNALVGMQAVVMDDAIVGEYSIVAAMAFVKDSFEVPDKSLVAGIPAKVIRDLTNEEIQWKVRGTEIYQFLACRHLETSREVEPLEEIEDARPSLPSFLYDTKDKFKREN